VDLSCLAGARISDEGIKIIFKKFAVENINKRAEKRAQTLRKKNDKIKKFKLQSEAKLRVKISLNTFIKICIKKNYKNKNFINK